MNFEKTVDLYMRLFNVSKEYAEQSLIDMKDFIIYLISLGKTFELPDLLRIVVEYQPRKSVYNFVTGVQEDSEYTAVPVLEIGRLLQMAANDSVDEFRKALGK